MLFSLYFCHFTVLVRKSSRGTHPVFPSLFFSLLSEQQQWICLAFFEYKVFLFILLPALSHLSEKSILCRQIWNHESAFWIHNDLRVSSALSQSC